MKLKNEEEINAKIANINKRLKNSSNLSLNELKELYNDLKYNKTYFIDATFKHNIRISKNIIKAICVLFDTYLMLIFGFNITIFLLFLFEVEILRIFEDIMYGKESESFNTLIRNLEDDIYKKGENNKKEIKETISQEETITPSYSLTNSMKLTRTLKKGE